MEVEVVEAFKDQHQLKVREVGQIKKVSALSYGAPSYKDKTARYMPPLE